MCRDDRRTTPLATDNDPRSDYEGDADETATADEPTKPPPEHRRTSTVLAARARRRHDDTDHDDDDDLTTWPPTQRRRSSYLCCFLPHRWNDEAPYIDCIQLKWLTGVCEINARCDFYTRIDIDPFETPFAMMKLWLESNFSKSGVFFARAEPLQQRLRINIEFWGDKGKPLSSKAFGRLFRKHRTQVDIFAYYFHDVMFSRTVSQPTVLMMMMIDDDDDDHDDGDGDDDGDDNGVDDEDHDEVTCERDNSHATTSCRCAACI